MYRIYLGLFLLLGFTSCLTDDKSKNIASERFEKGVFVISEGIFGQTSGTVTFINRDSQLVVQDIFKGVNNRDLGDVVQSMTVLEEKAYLVVNNANKIEVVNRLNFKELAQVIGLEQPRYMVVGDSNLAYISQWGSTGLDGRIQVLNTETNQILNSIPVGKGPEKMLFLKPFLYVTLAGGYGQAKELLKIDTRDLTITQRLAIGESPNSLQLSADGNSLWVACSGFNSYTTYPEIDSSKSEAGGLFKIDLNTFSISDSMRFSIGSGASKLVRNKLLGDVYYLLKNQRIHEFNANSMQLESLNTQTYYGLSFDQKYQEIYAMTYAGIQKAQANCFSTSGVLIDSFPVGFFANSCVFVHD